MTIEYQDGKLPFDSAQGPKLTHVRGKRKISFDQKKMLHAMKTFSILAPFENLRMTLDPCNGNILRSEKDTMAHQTINIFTTTAMERVTIKPMMVYNNFS